MTWQEHRMMTPEEYLRTLWRLGLCQTHGGRFLGVSERTSRRYVRGEADVPPAQVLLLRAMLELKARPVVPRKKPRQN
jgi:hypothetical protein